MTTLLLMPFPALLAISLHEAAHGLVAYWLGDATAKQLGRLTANPFKHIDPIGTVLVPIASALVIGIPFGWAKPVPVDMRNFVSPLKDMALVALAGPASNLLMAMAWTLVLLFFKTAMPAGEFGFYMGYMALIGVWFNLLLMILNLVPVPPLDGGRIVSGVLPPQLGWYYTRFESIGMWVVLFLFITGILGKILLPMVKGVQQQIFSLFGL